MGTVRSTPCNDDVRIWKRLILRSNQDASEVSTKVRQPVAFTNLTPDERPRVLRLERVLRVDRKEQDMNRQFSRAAWGGSHHEKLEHVEIVQRNLVLNEGPSIFRGCRRDRRQASHATSHTISL